MKSSIFVIAMLVIMSMTACTASDNDPMQQVETVDALAEYGARSLTTGDNAFRKLNLDELPGISAKEACGILAEIRKHSESEKHYDVKENLHDNHYDVDIVMDETISHKYTFTIQLHMQKDNENGVVYYKGYEANCSAANFAWYIRGFSFATDNATGDNKFESPSYLFFKVLGETVEYYQVPVKITGTYCPINNKAEFTYVL